LDLITTVFFRLAAFIFDGIHGVVIVKFYDIGLTRHSKAFGADRERPHGTDTPLFLSPAAVRSFMQYPPLRREAIFGPDLFEVDKSALARTVQVMLQSGEHDVISFVIHRKPLRTCSVAAAKFWHRVD